MTNLFDCSKVLKKAPCEQSNYSDRLDNILIPLSLNLTYAMKNFLNISHTTLFKGNLGKLLQTLRPGTFALIALLPFALTAQSSNVAKGKAARQSSNAFSTTASLAVDGNTNGKWGSNTITHTNEENNPWWEVDLGGVYDISEIKIWNRTDACCWNRLQNFYTMVSENPISANSTTANQYTKGPLSFSGAAETSKSLKGNAKGRYVRIFIAKDKIPLSLAEVEVMGKPAQVSCEASTAKLKYQTSMNKGDKLLEGEKLVSSNGKYQLRGTSSGDFVIEEVLNSANCQYREVWRFPLAGPINNPPQVSWLSLNTDCNICIGSKQNKGYCITNGLDDMVYIAYKCQKAVLTDDGRLVLQDAAGGDVWSMPDPFRLLPAGSEGVRQNHEIAAGRDINLEVLFVDWPDQPASNTNFDELWNMLTSNGELNRAFERQGAKIKTNLNKSWKRMPKSLSYYFPTNTDAGNWLWQDYTKHSVELLGQGANYPPNTIVVVVPNKGATGFKSIPSGAHGAHNFRGLRKLVTIMPAAYEAYQGIIYTTLMHEIGHCFGSGELYPASAPYLHEVGCYDAMGACGCSTGFMGWHRYRYGWLTRDRIQYLNAPGNYKIDLKKLSGNSGRAMVVMPDKTKPSKMWVIEIGQDVVTDAQLKAGKGEKLNAEGERLIVYTVEDPVVSGKRAIRIVPRVGFSPDPYTATAKWFDDASYKEGQNFNTAGAPFTFSIDKKTSDGFSLTVRVK